MFDITLRGTYSAKFSFNLFGRRIVLGTRKGVVNSTIHLLQGLTGSRRQDFGPVEAYAILDQRALEVGLTAANGAVPLWTQKWPVREIVESRMVRIAFDVRGIKLDADVLVQAVG